MKKNIITGKIEIFPTQPKPYRISFEYKGDEGLRERLLNYSSYNNSNIFFKRSALFKNRWVISNGEDVKLPFNFFALHRLITKDIFIEFLDRKSAEKAIIEIELLLNEYLKDIQKEYEKLLLEKERV